MSILGIGGQSSSLMQLMHDKRTAMQAMMSAVQSGDMQTAQAQAQTVQNDMSQIGSLTGSNGTQDASGGSANTFRSTMKTDLTNLLGAVQSGDQTKAQAALSKMQADRASMTVNNTVAGSGNADGDGDHDGSKASATTASTASPFATDLKSLLSAMVSGDATAMQGAANALDADIQKVVGSSASSTSSSTTGTSTTPDTSSTSTANKFLSDLEALVGAAKGGDLSGAGAATINVASDLTSAVGGGHGGHHHHGHGGGSPSTQAASSSTNDTMQMLKALLQGTPSSTPGGTTASSSPSQLLAA